MLSEVFGQRLRRRPRQHAAVKIEAPIMTRAPNYGLAWQKRNGASFVRALRAERVQLIGGLQNYYALPAHRNDNKLVLLQFGRFIASQTRRPRRSRLRQRLEVTNNWVGDTDQPAEQARAQKKIEKMAARRYCTGSFSHAFVHFRSSIRRTNLFQVFTPARQRPGLAGTRGQERADCCDDKYL
jgi:hypothetical protein